ncbi:MAG: hypothetical protein J0I20_21410 [Chloroflexi bacterium]|nr:hypothetical protein [Chloroflexota bacterium]OJV99879.1 MAG: hypothetical protein BGO39_29345 [Chloroflexi bacterium 54-19]
MTAYRSRTRPFRVAIILFTYLLLFSFFGPQLGQSVRAAEPVPVNLLPPPAPTSLAESQRFSNGAARPNLALNPPTSGVASTLSNEKYGEVEHLMGVGPAAVGKIQARGDQLVDGNGVRYFVAGINYEGPTDRAWTMWQNDKFDPNLIGQNMAQAAAGGYNSVRIFIQDSLRDDLLANRWDKLDTVAALAQKNGLRLLITFADYYEPDLTKLAQVDRLVAQHFAGSPVILGYDLRNELQLPELLYSIYPGGPAPLQTDDLIRFYGEKMSQSAVDAYRKGDGADKIPSHLNARQAYIYVNMLKLYDQFQNDVYTWVVNHSADRQTDMDYFSSYESTKWNPFMGALNATIQRYIDVRQQAIFLADPGRLTTIGWNRPEMARLPANNSLGFISFHRFPGDAAEGLAGTLSMINYLKSFFVGKPVVMEEFGYSNNDGKNDIPMLKTASYEASVWLFLYGRNYAGGFKWMLNNFVGGANPYENNFGLFDNNGQPKPAYFSGRAVLHMVAANPQVGGDFQRLETFDGVTISYMWSSNNARLGNGSDFNDQRFQLQQSAVAPWSVWWSDDNDGEVWVSTTAAGNVTLDMPSLFAGWKQGADIVVTTASGGQAAFNRLENGEVILQTQPGELYNVKAPLNRVAFNRAEPRTDTTDNTFFPETGHNLSNIFKDYWERKGGLAIYGFPISEEFLENGYTVQYFERARFEHHPENQGDSVVLLGLLGNTVTNGRRDNGETAFQPIAPFNSTAGEDYFKETGHSLRGGFKTFWENNGGLAQFGFPITEEFQEVNPSDGKTYTVQYFERNRFEWHPENAGTPSEFELGLLGQQVARAKGWIS